MFDSDRKQDELLAIRCQLGEASAFDELIARWHEPLWKYLRRLTGDEDVAADAVQDVWLRILRGMPRLRDGSRLRAWIFGIARRVVMDRLREKYAEPVRVAEELTLIEIGEVAGVPVGTVKSRLFRARKTLRDQLILKGVKR